MRLNYAQFCVGYTELEHQRPYGTVAAEGRLFFSVLKESIEID